MTTLTATTAAAISRVLGSTFRKSETHTTRIKGWYNVHEGFVVEQVGQEVRVSYELGNWNHGTREEAARLTDSLLGQYASYLRNKGYEVTSTPNTLRVIGRA